MRELREVREATVKKLGGADKDKWEQTVSERPRPVTLVEDVLMYLKLNTAGCGAYEIPDVKGKEGWSLSGFSRLWPKLSLPHPGTHSAQAQSPR